MKKVFATMLIAATTLGVSGIASAATDEAKATFTAAKEIAAADYKLARENCNSLTGNPKDICKEEASAKKTHTIAEAESQYKNTPAARASARKAIANADYGVAKAKCGSMTGNARDVCIKEAKAVSIAAQADATADKKVTIARTDARDDKVAANYKVALEKCDAMAGPAKEACVANAKMTFGK